jgi:hypothetical protein
MRWAKSLNKGKRVFTLLDNVKKRKEDGIPKAAAIVNL